MAELVVFLRSREIARHPVKSALITIGRDGGSDVVIDNPGVSRTHAVILFQQGQFKIRDSGSQNGIKVNGRQVSEAELKFGDIVGVNKFKIHFSAAGGVPPDLLAPPTKQIGSAPDSVVATMTVNAEAARRMQRDFVQKRRAQVGATEAANTDGGGFWAWAWWLSVAAALIGLAIYRSVS